MKSARLKAVQPDEAQPAPEREAPWCVGALQGGTWEQPDGSVDSVQWVDLPGPGDLDLAWIEPAYFAWVPTLSVGTVLSRQEGEEMTLGIIPFHWPKAIRLSQPAVDADSLARSILGGMLAQAGGSIGFELERRPEGLRMVVAVRGLRPRLPRFLYFSLQAQLHERSTFAFLRQVRTGWRRRANALEDRDG